MKIKQLLTYAIPIAIGGAVIYYLVTRPPAVPPAAVPTPPTMVPVPEGTITRGLIPADLGVTSWDFALLANQWNTVINTTVPRGVKSIKFQGVSFAGTNATQIRITAGAAVREIWSITRIPGLISQIWYDPSPSTATENQPVIVDVYSKGVATETVSLIGEVTEIRGRTIA